MMARIKAASPTSVLQEQEWLDQAADIMAARRLLAKEEANMRAAIAIYGSLGNSRV